MSDEIKEIAKRFEELYNTGNTAIYDEIYSTRLINHAYYAGACTDFESCRECVPKTRAGMPDFRLNVEDTIVADDKLVCRWVAHGTHSGNFSGIPASGNKVCWTGITIFQIEAGKIVEAWWNEDVLGLLRQIGVVPTP